MHLQAFGLGWTACLRVVVTFVNRHSYYVAILAICGVVWFEIDKPRNLYRYGKD